MEHAQGIVRFQQDYGTAFIQDGTHGSLKSMGCESGLIIYHGVKLNVALESDKIIHLVQIEGLLCKLIEIQSLFNGKK